jgi:hypothetical protein
MIPIPVEVMPEDDPIDENTAVSQVGFKTLEEAKNGLKEVLSCDDVKSAYIVILTSNAAPWGDLIGYYIHSNPK